MHDPQAESPVKSMLRHPHPPPPPPTLQEDPVPTCHVLQPPKLEHSSTNSRESASLQIIQLSARQKNIERPITPQRKAKPETTPFSTVHNAADSELETSSSSSSSSSSNKKIELREPHEKCAPAINRTMRRNKHPDEEKRRNTLVLVLLLLLLHVQRVGGDQSAKP
jgi:hypothetical protein